MGNGDSGFGIRDSGFGIWDLGFGIWDSEKNARRCCLALKIGSDWKPDWRGSSAGTATHQRALPRRAQSRPAVLHC
ncbi:hypothetical protein EIQ01_16840 [Xanthomonas campestris pv. raphani]